MRQRSITVLASALAALIGVIPLHASSIFINGDVTVGTATPFQDTNNGITATFSSPSDDGTGAFQTNNTTGFFSWGPEMVNTVIGGSSLTISFSQALASISMNFGTLTADEFDLNAFLGGSPVGSNNATGSLVVSAPEGLITFSGATFNSVVLSSASTIIAVGNITATAAAPEPSYFWAFSAIGLALVILGSARLRPRGGQLRG